VKRLAAALDVDHHKVSAALRRAGLPIPLPRKLHHPQLHDVDWLRQALATLSTEDVARQLGCTPQSVRYAALKHGVLALVNGHDPPPASAQRWRTGRGWRRAAMPAQRWPSWRTNWGPRGHGWPRRCAWLAFRN
jgi:hypothetical protein